MLHHLKISHHTHTGKLRSHEYTSYLPLLILLGIVGFVLSVYSVSAASPGPESGSIGISGTMPGKPPTTAATITKPSTGARFQTSPVEISGSCPAGTLVELFKNDIFAGSTICSEKGVYLLDIDLMIGKNTLIARVYDALNQAGPDSNSIEVYYDALPPQGAGITSLDFGGAQLLLNTDAVYRGIFPEKTMVMPIEILGGTAPYAVNVNWGDSSNNVMPRNDNLGFNADHAYKKPGTYQISIQGTDADGRVAFLTVAAIVNGIPESITSSASTASNSDIIGQLLVLWPLYISAAAIVVSFWLGEMREKRLLEKAPTRPSITYHNPS